jgi:16S rRNA (guanine527-N7)-methyltransferase
MKSKRADEEMANVSKDDWQLLADEALFIPSMSIERRLLVLTPIKTPLPTP